MRSRGRLPAEDANAEWLSRWLSSAESGPVDPDTFAEVQRVARFRQVVLGTRLISAGSRIERVLVVRRGLLHVLAPGHQGGRTLTEVVWPGGLVGDVALMLSQPSPVDVVAGDHSTLMELEAARFLSLLRHSQSLSTHWTNLLARRLSVHDRRLRSLLTATLTGQVADFLLEQLERTGGGRGTVPLSHAAIADLVGVSRQSVSEVMRVLRERGLVATGYRTIEVLDAAGLARVAGTTRPAGPDTAV